jgi:hypothetical protein
MKKYHFITLVIIISFFSFNCRKYDESENYLRGILDGQPFDARSMWANKPEPIPGSGSDGQLRITAEIPGNLLSLRIYQPGIIKEGIYDFIPQEERYALLDDNTTIYYAGQAGIYNAPVLVGSGRITITEISKRYVKGTFEATLVHAPNSTKTITNGEFSIVRK